MLEDCHRVDAYERAIRALVRPGDVVLDLGAGTGILAMLAARRGAARVHAVESMPVAGLCAQLVEANGLDGIVVTHRQDARTMPPVEPVDLVISDFLGTYVIDDDMLEAVRAAGRWLKPGGRFCPSRIEMMVAPVGGMTVGAIDLFNEPFYGLDLRLCRTYARNYCYGVALVPGVLMSEPEEFHRMSPPDDGGPFDRRLSFTMARDGRIRGLAGWFQATLADGVVMSTAPGIETHWGQVMFPTQPLEVRAGDVMSVRLWLEGRGADGVWHWDGDLAGVPFTGEGVQRLGEREPDHG